jgi:DNA polymerase-3 subunit epsilon
MKLIFFDLETTGTNFWQHGIHQISGAIEIDGEVKESFNFKVAPNPNAKTEQGALDVGGVTIEQIKAYEPMKEVFVKFVDMLSKYVDRYDKKDKFFLVGYNNASFDNQFLRAWFKQNNDDYFGSWFWSSSIDVMVLATLKLMEQRSDMIDFKLKTVARQLGIEIDESKLHDANYDIEITRQIYYEITK